MSHRTASTRLPGPWTVGAVARKTKLHRNTVAGALLRESDPRLSTLLAIARAVGVPPVELWPELGDGLRRSSP